MFCPNCGKPVRDKEHFCVHCGNALPKNIFPSESEDSPKTDYSLSYDEEPQKGSMSEIALKKLPGSQPLPFENTPSADATPRNKVYGITVPNTSGTIEHIDTKKEQKKSRSPLKAILIILAIILGITVIANLLDKSDEDLEPVTEPKSGAILVGSEDLYGSEITVTASRGESCVVKLKTRSGTTRLSFYVRAGDTVTVGVPSEYLYVYFASGDTWYGESNLFGKHTSYSMDDELCDFTEYTWEYELYPTSDGNFSQTPIDEDEF